MMRRDRKLFIIFSIFAIFGTARCTVWDPAVGVRCDEYPVFCVRAGANGPSDAGGDRTIDLPADAGDVVNVADTGAPVSFARDIRRLMNRSETDPSGPGCSHCHYRTTGTQQGIIEGQIDMTTLGDLRRGGKTSHARVIVPGDPEASAIVQKLRGTYPVGARMPWSGPPYWTDAEIELMARWIAQGARGADDE
jgi:hypothetical protein